MAKAKTKGSVVATATLRDVRIPPRKARLVLEMVKGKQLDPALNILAFNTRKGANLIKKLLDSAIANVQNGGKVDVDSLWITGGHVDMGKTMHRFMPRAQGRATPIRKRSSHITIELGVR